MAALGAIGLVSRLFAGFLASTPLKWWLPAALAAVLVPIIVGGIRVHWPRVVLEPCDVNRLNDREFEVLLPVANEAPRRTFTVRVPRQSVLGLSASYPDDAIRRVCSRESEMTSNNSSAPTWVAVT
ncbi:MAG: hypothetical protein DCC49_06945 [Acidobacteria bacterium]|nr:MAG: hypothetical protein DCC49_06945 [Acidobacteriota bacterium]